MNLITTDYGDIQYSNEDLILFADGIFGFQDLTDFLLISLDDGDDDSILILQSVQKPEISFAVLNPLLFCPDYSPVLTPEELFSLDVSDSGELSYYVICVVKKEQGESTVNLKAPLAINPQTLKGMQVILEGSQYGFRQKIGDFLQDSEYFENGSDTDADFATEKR